MSKETSKYIIRICALICVLSLILTFAYDKALANTSTTQETTAVDELAESTGNIEQKVESKAQKTFDQKSVLQAATSSAAVGVAVGATNYASELKKRAWLDPVAMPEYPMEVKYSVKQKNSFAKTASMWGIPVSELLALNPGFTAEDVLEPGIELTVLKRYTTDTEPLSVGATNRGRILNGWLMPEGDEASGYFLRDERQRSYATANAIAAVRGGLKAYAEKYPGSPQINIGDFSKRKGGKIKPHSSHTSGRDVDIGFVHTPDVTMNDKQHFTRASWSNVDIEKTWFAIKSIIATGEVKSIYLDLSVQKMLYSVAKYELNEKQLEAIFSIPKRPDSNSALIQHWPGHKNHAHIRFYCPENQPRCRR